MPQFEELTICSQYRPTVKQAGGAWETHWPKIHHDEIDAAFEQCITEHGLFTADQLDEEVRERTGMLRQTIADLRRELRRAKKETPK